MQPTAHVLVKVIKMRIVEAFTAYMEREGGRVTHALFERNLSGKLRDPQFGADIGLLLAHGYRWNMGKAAQEVSERLIALLLSMPRTGVNKEPM